MTPPTLALRQAAAEAWREALDAAERGDGEGARRGLMRLSERLTVITVVAGLEKRQKEGAA